MNASIGLRTQTEFFTDGGSGRAIGRNDQWSSNFAPAAIQRRNYSISSADIV
jgi:hypothetical protein